MIVTTICDTISHAVAKNIKEYGVYVPPGILRNKRIRASLDNVDKKMDTPDGKGSFHGTAMAVYQRSGQGKTVVKPVQFSESPTSESLHDVPPTILNLATSDIEGSPKPRTSPHYSSYKIGVYDEYYMRSQSSDIQWMVARFFNRPGVQELGSEVS